HEIQSVIDAASLVRPDIFELCRWIAEYYVSPFGEVLKAALPPAITSKHIERRPATTRADHVVAGFSPRPTLTTDQTGALSKSTRPATNRNKPRATTRPTRLSCARNSPGPRLPSARQHHRWNPSTTPNRRSTSTLPSPHALRIGRCLPWKLSTCASSTRPKAS